MTTDVLTFGPDDNVADAMRTLVDRSIDGAPVVAADGTVVGMLSTGDLIVQESKLHFPTVISLLGATLELPSAQRQFDDDLRRALGSTVAEVMHRDPVTVAADDTVERAATLMHDHDVSRLPVVGDGGLAGIVARVDILRAIIRDDAD
ncbi:MAG: CBS domain-containing protein [Actinobacteria bacterium]|nr:CBS domain-containing protein [Actinomycetota bacterium]